MVERGWTDNARLHAAELHSTPYPEDKESLPLGVPDHCCHHDLLRIHHSARSEPITMLR